MKIYILVQYNTDTDNGLYGTVEQEWYFKNKKNAEKLMEKFDEDEDWFRLTETTTKD